MKRLPIADSLTWALVFATITISCAEEKPPELPVERKDSEIIAFAQAAIRGDMQFIKDATKKGFDVNSNIKNAKLSLLFLAVSRNKAEVAYFLLEQGADPNIGKLNLPLIAATDMDSRELVTALLKHGAKVDGRDEDGNTALHYAKSIQVAKLLVEARADLNAANSTGITPLDAESEMGNFEIIKLLVENGARLDLKSKDGKTALDFAKDEKVKAYLLSQGTKHDDDASKSAASKTE